MTTAPGVFAGGDVAFGPRILVEAVANGHRAPVPSTCISAARQEDGPQPVSHLHQLADAAGLSAHPAPAMPVLPTNRRIGIAEVELGFDEAQGRAEGQRCLKCQVNTIFDGSKCILCGGCVDVCPEYCLRLVDLSQVRGDERYETLIEKRYGCTTRDLPAGQASAIIKDEDKCIRCGLCAAAVSDPRHHHGGTGTAGTGGFRMNRRAFFNWGAAGLAVDLVRRGRALGAVVRFLCPVYSTSRRRPSRSAIRLTFRSALPRFCRKKRSSSFATRKKASRWPAPSAPIWAARSSGSTATIVSIALVTAASLRRMATLLMAPRREVWNGLK